MRANLLRTLIAVLLFSFPLQSSFAGPAYADGLFTKEERESFKNSINQIARTLINNAVKKDQGIGWVRVTKEGKSEESLDFYNGNSGICYFLLKAYAATREKEYLEKAKEGMAYILSQGKRDDKGLYFYDRVNGLFSGNAGPGYLFLYAFRATKDKQYLKLAEDVAARIVAMPDTADRSSPDIIAGAAGSGYFLLKMYEVTKNSKYLEAAEKLGDFIISQAEPQPKGVKWKIGNGNVEYYFVGFSHGPAGMGYYLDRLYRVTKKEQYKEYADKAMQHIEDIAISEKGYVKWYHEQLQQNTRYSSQWCHGAPGMNPFFLELYSRSKDQRYLDWATKNTLYLLDQGVNVRKNASVCHGISGNTASLYTMYEATKKSSYLDEIHKAVKLLDETAEKGPNGYYWEPVGFKTDYSYMTGLAGIGDFYVLLYSDGKFNMMGGLGYGDDL